MNVILVLDVGSSSVRCSAYQIVENENDGTTSVEALDGCYAQLKIRSVQPNSGKIILNGVKEDTGESYNLLDEIDGCIHKTLASLREHDFSSFQIVGLGFSTLVMNLIGVDKNGNVIGEEATISYACNLPEVAQKCRNLKRFVVVWYLIVPDAHIYISLFITHTQLIVNWEKNDSRNCIKRRVLLYIVPMHCHSFAHCIPIQIVPKTFVNGKPLRACVCRDGWEYPLYQYPFPKRVGQVYSTFAAVSGSRMHLIFYPPNVARHFLLLKTIVISKRKFQSILTLERRIRIWNNGQN